MVAVGVYILHALYPAIEGIEEHHARVGTAVRVIGRKVLNAIHSNDGIPPPRSGALRASPVRHVQSWSDGDGISAHRCHFDELLLGTAETLAASRTISGAANPYGFAHENGAGVGFRSCTRCPAASIVTLVENQEGSSRGDVCRVA